ncbi:unnamed protein product [Dovyalis caffra]|uniref:Uncharacterized protein n=1 Tax=Dovyalis caffra TaxID=77055 RepID=A0AAV1S6P0_9ROSI|nr:unnamed protein product [Dovyalis caffra]
MGAVSPWPSFLFFKREKWEGEVKQIVSVFCSFYLVKNSFGAKGMKPVVLRLQELRPRSKLQRLVLILFGASALCFYWA